MLSAFNIPIPSAVNCERLRRDEDTGIGSGEGGAVNFVSGVDVDVQWVGKSARDLEVDPSLGLEEQTNAA